MIARVAELTRAFLRAYAGRNQSAYERWLKRLVEIPTVSSDPARGADVARGARAAAELVEHLGGRARLVKTGGHPLLLGEFPGPKGSPTLTLYNHLDVQPADREAEGWRTEPFRFVRKDGRYFGRGTTDDKGPALAALFGVAAAHAAGVPATVKLLWETEEEIGSPNFERALKRLGRGVATDAVVISDGQWLTRRRPTVAAGLRGFKGFRFTLETAEGDVHSGIAGGAVRNPLAELMDLACALHDPRTGRVKVPGFYDGIVKPTKKERADFLHSGFTVSRFKKDNHAHRLRSEDALEVMESLWTRPTFEVHGLAGGHQGPGLKSIVPARGELKVSCRLVPGQDPDRIGKLVVAFAKKHNPDVVAETTPGGAASMWEATGPLAVAVKAAVKFAFGATPAFVRDGGSVGAVITMERVLRCPVGFLDLSMPDHGYHAPNENFEWAQAEGGMAAFARLVLEFAAEHGFAPRPPRRAR
jgi:acetylornithine deacetylase/succinyl-diaminopimelate desuccinylase-like protein